MGAMMSAVRTSLIALIACAAFLAESRLIAAEDPSCDALTKFAKDTSKALPKKIDEVTRLVELTVNCETRIVKYVKHLSIDVSGLAKGAEQRKQEQYISLHCNQDGLARQGWNVWDYIYDSKQNLVITLKASPKDCK
jgi:hypothetical protein